MLLFFLLLGHVAALRLIRAPYLMTSSLQGYEKFVRNNPQSDKISARCFHHVEFYCGDSTNTYKRFNCGLGMELISKSDLSTGNTVHASYMVQSGDMRMVFTAPYLALDAVESASALPGFSASRAQNFTAYHGLGVSAIAIEVDNVRASFEMLLAGGAAAVLSPTQTNDAAGRGSFEIAEVQLYGDVVLRLLNLDAFSGAFLPNFQDTRRAATTLAGSQGVNEKIGKYGLYRYDHIVGNLWSLQPSMARLIKMTGFHEFAEFVAEDVGTVDSGLNSVVLANNNEMILLPLNEPTFGTKRKSQIQTYLEQNRGEGVQHMALFSRDIIDTLSKMRAVSELGGFEFMDPPHAEYYRNVRARLGDALSEEMYRQIEEQGLLADKDDRGVLLQVFTKPVGDRPTLFLEIIQRIGCIQEDGAQKPGCGGFGKGNFKDLFKSIEDYEKTLKI